LALLLSSIEFLIDFQSRGGFYEKRSAAGFQLSPVSKS